MSIMYQVTAVDGATTLNQSRKKKKSNGDKNRDM